MLLSDSGVVQSVSHPVLKGCGFTPRWYDVGSNDSSHFTNPRPGRLSSHLSSPWFNASELTHIMTRHAYTNKEEKRLKITIRGLRSNRMS